MSESPDKSIRTTNNTVSMPNLVDTVSQNFQSYSKIVCCLIVCQCEWCAKISIPTVSSIKKNQLSCNAYIIASHVEHLFYITPCYRRKANAVGRILCWSSFWEVVKSKAESSLRTSQQPLEALAKKAKYEHTVQKKSWRAHLISLFMLARITVRSYRPLAYCLL